MSGTAIHGQISKLNQEGIPESRFGIAVAIEADLVAPLKVFEQLAEGCSALQEKPGARPGTGRGVRVVRLE